MSGACPLYSSKEDSQRRRRESLQWADCGAWGCTRGPLWVICRHRRPIGRRSALAQKADVPTFVADVS